MKLPKGWKQCSLLDCMKLVSGGTPSKERRAYWDGCIPWVPSKDMKVGRINDTEDHLTEFGAENGTRLVPKNTILFVVRGMILARDFPVALTKRTVAFNQDLKAVETVGHVDTEFLYQWLKGSSNLILNGADEAGHGTKRLQTDQLLGLPISVPPINEQRKIAEILGAWDDGLEKLDAVIAAKERRKKGLMQRLLTGKRRVKGFKSRWATFKLGKLFSERVEQNRDDLPLLAITADRGGVPRDELSKRDTSSEDKSKYLRIAPGDIGYNTMRMWQGVSAMSALEGIISPAYTVCVPSEKIDGRFAAHFFKLPHTVHLFHRYSQGLVDDTLNLKYLNFATIEVYVPLDVAEQRAIADILDACDEELRLLRDQRGAIERQKRGLMQRLLTGKVRVDIKKGGE